MTCQSLISDLSDVESPSVATARMHLLRRFSRDGPEKLAVHAAEPAVRFWTSFWRFCNTDFCNKTRSVTSHTKRSCVTLVSCHPTPV